MLIGGIFDECIAASFFACGLGCSTVSDRENTGGDLVASRLSRADELFGIVLLVEVDAVVRPTASISVRTLEGTGKKLRQSS